MWKNTTIDVISNGMVLVVDMADPDDIKLASSTIKCARSHTSRLAEND